MNRTRKIFLALIVCVVVLFAAACGNDNASFKHGSWSDNTYTSKFLGLKIQLGSDWMASSDDILAKTLGISDMSDSSLRTVFDKGGAVVEMSALRSDASSISITVMDNDTAEVLNEEDFFSEENISRLKADFESTGSECTVYKDTVRFLGKDTDCINLAYTVQLPALSTPSCEILIPFFKSHYTAIITFSANDRVSLSELLGVAAAI